MTDLKQVSLDKLQTQPARSTRNNFAQSLTELLDAGPSVLAQQIRQIVLICRRNADTPVPHQPHEKPLTVDQARVAALTGNMALLTENQIHSLLSEAKQLENLAVRLPLMAQLIQRLPASTSLTTIRDILNQADNLSDPASHAQTLFQIAPLLAHADRGSDLLSPSLVKALAVSQAMSSPDARIRSLSALAAYVPVTMQIRLLRHIFDEIDVLQSSELRSSAISVLAEHLPSEIRARGLKSASSIASPHERARALIALAPHVPPDLAPGLHANTLTAIRLIADEEERAKALVGIVPYLEDTEDNSEYPALLKLALGIVVDFNRRHLRARALVALSPHLTHDLKKEALATIQGLTDENERTILLGEIAPSLPRDLLPAALTITQTLNEPSARVHALIALIQYLPEKSREKALHDALNTANALSHHYERVVALVALLDVASATIREQISVHTLETVQSIRNENARARALSLLGSRLSEHQLDHAVEIANQLHDPNHRLLALTGIVPHVPAPQQSKILTGLLNTINQIPFEYQRARALISIAPMLSTQMLQKILPLADSITEAFDRVSVYTALAQHLPPGQRQPLIGKAWKQIRRINNGYDRASALVSIAPFLPMQIRESLPQVASKILDSIGDEYDRTSAIGILAPLLATNDAALHPALPDYNQIIEKGLQLAFQVSHQLTRAQVLAQGTLIWQELYADDHSYHLWRNVAQSLSLLPLADTILCLSALMPIIRKLGGDDAVHEVIYILEHI